MMFWKLLLSYGMLSLLTLTVFAVVLARSLESEQSVALRATLDVQAKFLVPIVVEALVREKNAISPQFVRTLTARTAGRVTILDKDGALLADSEFSPAPTGNPWDRPVIAQARKSGSGFAIRPSSTSGPATAYLCLRLDEGAENLGFLLLAIPESTLPTQAAARDHGFRNAALAAVFLAAALGGVMAWRFAHRLQDLSMTAQAISLGDYDRSIDASAPDEIGALARSFRQMRDDLRQRIAGIERIRKDLQTMLETIPEGVIAIDEQQCILFANPSTVRLFGLGRANLVGQRLWEVLRHPKLLEAVSATLASFQPYNTEFEIHKPSRVLAFRGRALTVESGRGVIIVLQDITELRRLERLRQDFFANVSHELKTPLASIKAFTETLLDDVEDKETVMRFLRRIEEQADRLHILVIDMLMLARVESTDHGFDIGPIDAGEAVHACIDAFHGEADAKQIELSCVISDNARWVLADSEGLFMILSNLVDNALKYTQRGGRVTLRTDRTAEGVGLHIEDTGIGIPDEDLGRVFERFYRVDKARSRELGGTGLGLSIVKHLAQTFGGTVSVTSRLNRGTTFSVVLSPTESPLEHLSEYSNV